jgi:hypothetical protein
MESFSSLSALSNFARVAWIDATGSAGTTPLTVETAGRGPYMACIRYKFAILMRWNAHTLGC